MPRFGSRLNTERLDRLLLVAGKTPAQLAEDARVSAGTVWRARHGQRVTRSSVIAIAVTLARYEMNPAVEALLPPLEGGADVGGRLRDRPPQQRGPAETALRSRRLWALRAASL